MKKKQRTERRGIKKLFGLLGRDRRLLIVSFVLAALYAVTQALIPLLMGNATTVLADGANDVIGDTGTIDFAKIGQILLTALIILALNWVFLMLQNRIVIGITQHLALNIRTALAEKIGRLPVSYYESRAFGDVLSTVTYDVMILTDGFQNFFVQLVSAPMYIIALLVIMFRIHWAMALATLVSLPLSALGARLVLSRSQKYYDAYQQGQGELDGQIEEMLTGFQVLKLFRYEKQALERFRKANRELSHSGEKSLLHSWILSPVTSFVSNLSYAVVLVLGGYLACIGAISVGHIQSFINYVNSINEPIQQMANLGSVLQSVNAASERVFDFLEAEEEPAVEAPVAVPAVKGDVRFDGVRFGYVPEKTIIHHFDLEVKAGSHIAIVGPTGAGKSTLIKLLMRFYDVNGGAIRVDGQDITRMDRADLHKGLGIVLQETWLFDGTILDNVRLGRLQATDEEVLDAIRQAGADYFVNTLPGRERFVLHENGGNISAGQRQLLTIARAILADRPILILDEATSSVDTQTELRIQEAMDRLMRGRTSFVIAHRLSTIVNADCILYLENGDVVEQGTHQELMDRHGAYRRLFDSQFM